MKKNLAFLFLIATLLTACGGTSTTPSLRDTTWELVSYGPVDNPIAALAKVEATISFGNDGNFNGNVGCNGFFGGYKISGDNISAGPLAATEMYCEATMEQESAVLKLLNGELAFESNGESLTIFSKDGSSALNLIRINN